MLRKIKYIVILGLMFLASIFFDFSIVQGTSMEPTIKANDIIIIQEYFNLSRNDIIVAEVNDKQYLKRIVGLPGDQIKIDEYNDLYVNNVLYPTNCDQNCPEKQFYTLAQEEYFVIGDNSMISLDSRLYGPVTTAQIEGKVLFT